MVSKILPKILEVPMQRQFPICTNDALPPDRSHHPGPPRREAGPGDSSRAAVRYQRMATVLTIDATDFIETDCSLPNAAAMSADWNAKRLSPEVRDRCVEKAIEAARKLVGGISGNDGGPGIALYNIVITIDGSMMAMVRWNLDAVTAEDNSAVE